MDLAGTLTEQEVQAAEVATFDLSSAYPQAPVPSYVRELYTSDEIHSLSLRFPPMWTAVDQLALDRELEDALVRFLGLKSESYNHISVAPTGSVALNRALTAAIAMSTDVHREDVHVITTSPSIDIMKLLLQEQSTRIHFVESRTRRLGGLDRDAVVSQIHKAALVAKPSHIVTLLTSPENPTGEVWSAEDLRSIAGACHDCGGVLIVDHSLLTAGIHETYQVSPAWEVLSADIDWIALWDTGKTFGLNEDKLGFMICSSPRIARPLRKALSVIQFGVSRRQKLFFSRLLRGALKAGHIGTLRDMCRANLDTAVRIGGASRLNVRDTDAGSVALVELPDAVGGDEHVRTALLAKGVGVVAGRVFFHTGWRPSNLIRIALARDPTHFEHAFSILVSEVNRFVHGVPEIR